MFVAILKRIPGTEDKEWRRARELRSADGKFFLRGERTNDGVNWGRVPALHGSSA